MDRVESEIRRLVEPMLLYPLPEAAYPALARYVELLRRWGARMNLTAVRDRDTLIRLHLGECLRCAQILPEGIASMLDLGSGAGLPGIPIQIARPELAVTLAESRVRKAAFLREAVRDLSLHNAAVFGGRAEDLPPGALFDVVTVRAADRMDRAVEIAASRIRPDGRCMVLTSKAAAGRMQAALPDFEWRADAVPGTRQRILLVGMRADPERDGHQEHDPAR